MDWLVTSTGTKFQKFCLITEIMNNSLNLPIEWKSCTQKYIKSMLFRRISARSVDCSHFYVNPRSGSKVMAISRSKILAWRCVAPPCPRPSRRLQHRSPQHFQTPKFEPKKQNKKQNEKQNEKQNKKTKKTKQNETTKQNNTT